MPPLSHQNVYDEYYSNHYIKILNIFNGMAPYYYDHFTQIRFWTIDEHINSKIYLENGGDSLIIGDYLIQSDYLTIDRSGIVSMRDDQAFQQVFLEDFIKQYIKGDYDI